jgi:hypothetical protein
VVKVLRLDECEVLIAVLVDVGVDVVEVDMVAFMPMPAEVTDDVVAGALRGLGLEIEIGPSSRTSSAVAGH